MLRQQQTTQHNSPETVIFQRKLYYVYYNIVLNPSYVYCLCNITIPTYLHGVFGSQFSTLEWSSSFNLYPQLCFFSPILQFVSPSIGHRTYIAYIYMEYSCNNMILRQFAHLLLEAINKKNSQPRPHSELPSPPGVIQQREGEREREERRRGLGSSEKGEMTIYFVQSARLLHIRSQFCIYMYMYM